MATDPAITRVDAVVLQAGDPLKAIAAYKPHGNAPPMYFASAQVGGKQQQTAPAVAVDKDGYLTMDGVTKKPIAALEQGALKDVNAVVLHRTDSTKAQSAFDSFKTGVGTHFLIDKDGTIYQTASLNQLTYHVGKIRARCQVENTCSPQEAKTLDAMGFAPKKIHDHEAKKPYPDRYPTNSDSVGIEVVADYNPKTGKWEEPTPQQKAAIAKLVGNLQQTYGLNNADVYQHDTISYKTAGEGDGLWQGAAVQPGVANGVQTSAPTR